MKFVDTFPVVCGVKSICLCLLAMVIVSVHAGPSGGRNSLAGCRDRSSSCSNILPSDCYSEEDNFRCCRSCWNLSRQISRGPGCQYGDKDPEVCRFVRARHCGGQYYQKLCCATCENFTNGLRD